MLSSHFQIPTAGNHHPDASVKHTERHLLSAGNTDRCSDTRAPRPLGPPTLVMASGTVSSLLGPDARTLLWLGISCCADYFSLIKMEGNITSHINMHWVGSALDPIELLCSDTLDDKITKSTSLLFCRSKLITAASFLLEPADSTLSSVCTQTSVDSQHAGRLALHTYATTHPDVHARLK